MNKTPTSQEIQNFQPKCLGPEGANVGRSIAVTATGFVLPCCWLDRPDNFDKIMEDKKVAACQPKILSYKNKKLFEHAAASGGFIDKNYYPFCRGRIFNHVEEDTKQYDGKMEIFWATGACLMIRSNYFHEIEGFDDDF